MPLSSDIAEQVLADMAAEHGLEDVVPEQNPHHFATGLAATGGALAGHRLARNQIGGRIHSKELAEMKRIKPFISQVKGPAQEALIDRYVALAAKMRKVTWPGAVVGGIGAGVGYNYLADKVATDEKHVEDLSLGAKIKKHLPAVVGTGLGLGTYGLLRTRFPNKRFPVLSEIQKETGGNFHYLDSDPAVWRKIDKMNPVLRWLRRRVDPTISKSEAEALIEKGRASGKPPPIWAGDPEHSGLKDFYHPGFGKVITKEKELGHPLINDLYEGINEQKFIKRYNQGTSIKTLTLHDVMKKHKLKHLRSDSPKADFDKLQEALRKETGGKYILKFRSGAEATGGSLPTETDDLHKIHNLFKKRMGNKVEKLILPGKNPSSIVENEFNWDTERGAPATKGRVVSEIFDPVYGKAKHRGGHNVIVQPRIPFESYGPEDAAWLKDVGFPTKREYRIHVFGGKAPSSMAMPRYIHNAQEFLQAKAGAKWLQKNFLDKMPAHNHRTPYAIDLSPVEGGGFKIVELNTGTESGMLEPGYMAMQMGRTMTGKYPRAIAGAAGAVVGGVGAGGTAAYQELNKPKKETKQLAPSVG
jgi:hypothetical protein